MNDSETMEKESENLRNNREVTKWLTKNKKWQS